LAVEKWRFFLRVLGNAVASISAAPSRFFIFYHRRCAGFADGEFLSFASPKERNQRKGDPGSLESPEVCLDFEATAQTRDLLTSNRSDSALA